MPAEIRDSNVLLHDVLPDESTGLTLRSARASIAEPLEELYDCVANNEVPSEKLLNDLSVGFKKLYEFARLVETSFQDCKENTQRVEEMLSSVRIRGPVSI